MPQALIDIQMREVQPLAATDRNMRAWMKEGLRQALVYWHEHFLSFHFTTYAYARYPGVYKHRKGPGKRRYRGAGGEWRSTADARPLYETGAARTTALSRFWTSGASIGGGRGALTGLGQAIVQTGGATEGMVAARGVFEVPNYIAYLRGKGFDPDAELTTVNAEELTQMEHIAIEHVRNEHLKTLLGGAPSVGRLEEQMGLAPGG